MDEDELIESTNWRNDDTPRPRVSPYNLLMRQSRLMGRIATKTYDVTKEFLKRDVSTVPFYRSSRPVNHEASDLARAGMPKEAKREEKEAKKQAINLQHLVHRSHEVLMYARTVVLPMNLFPDSVSVDRTKVTIQKRTFFWSSQVISIRIEDVLNVSANYGPFFGSIMVSSRVMNSTDHYEVNYLWRKDAIALKHIIQGYVIAQHNNIDVSHLKKDELIKTLIELGTDVG